MDNCCCSNNSNNMSQNEMLNQIMSLNFAINDLTLYLDTHPNDSKALCMHNEYCNRVSTLIENYQNSYGPLSINSASNFQDWVESSWPWEGGNSSCTTM